MLHVRAGPCHRMICPWVCVHLEGISYLGHPPSQLQCVPIINSLSVDVLRVTTLLSSSISALSWRHVAHPHFWLGILTCAVKPSAHQSSSGFYLGKISGNPGGKNDLGKLEKEEMPSTVTIAGIVRKPSRSDDSLPSFLLTIFWMGWPHINHLNWNISKSTKETC